MARVCDFLLEDPTMFRKSRRWAGAVFLFAASASNLMGQVASVEGDVKAVRESLRRMHSSGPWVKENAAKRLPDWKAAAEKGAAEAMWVLGRWYLDGVEADDKKAIALITKSAEAGFGLAQNGLGYLYEHGQGVEKDMKKAVGWYRKAAEQDEPVGCHNLALLYEDGLGVEANMKDALRWYEKAAGKGYQPAIRRLV